MIVKTTQVAKSTPFDNASNGFVSNDTQAAIEEAKTGYTGGVTPPFIFGKDGSCTVGTYLRTHVVPGGPGGSGQEIKGTNKLVEVNVSVGVNIANTTRFQLSRRTAVNTWVDIPNAYVDIAAGQYKGSNTGLSISIGPDWELGCYNKSGSSANNTVVVIYLMPN